jgi:hypothetical protein
MSYTVCPNCGQNALPVATRCPKCGVAFESQFIRHAPPPPRRTPIGLILAGAVLTILAGNALWQKFGVTPEAAPFVRKPAPAPAPRPAPVSTPALAQAGPAAESLVTVRETAVTTPAPAPHVSVPPASPPPVAHLPVATSPAVSVPAARVSAATVPAATVRAPAPVVTAASTVRAAKTLYSSTWLNLRAERRNSSPVLRVLRPGEVVRVDSLSQGWYRVVSDADQPGWVDRRLLDSLPPR